MIRVGPAGWSYPDWVGPVYPSRKPRGFHALRFLSEFVDCVEVNSTFYAPPVARSCARWVELTADRPAFRFLAKLHRAFTHEPWAASRTDEARAYLDGVDPLAASGRLAALLVQFPVSFDQRPAAWERLERLAGLFASLPLVLEVRHRTWFDAPALDRLGRMGWSVAHLDLPAAHDHPPEPFDAPGPVGYLRLHGRNARAWFAKDTGRDARYDWLYSREQVEELARRARAIASRKADTYVVTNNHPDGKALANALELRSLLEGAPVSAPASLVEAFPQISDRTVPTGPASLFGPGPRTAGAPPPSSCP